MTQLTLSIQQIQEFGSLNFDGSTRVIPNTLKFGQYIAQGDLNFYYLGEDMDSLPFKDTLELTKVEDLKPEQLQLAEGNTKGSRHILSSFQNVEIYELPNANPIQGKILYFKGGETVTHPEHGDQVYRKGAFLVTFQVQRGEELARIQD